MKPFWGGEIFVARIVQGGIPFLQARILQCTVELEKRCLATCVQLTYDAVHVCRAILDADDALQHQKNGAPPTCLTGDHAENCDPHSILPIPPQERCGLTGEVSVPSPDHGVVYAIDRLLGHGRAAVGQPTLV